MKVAFENWRKDVRLVHRDVEKDSAILSKTFQELSSSHIAIDTKRLENLKMKLVQLKEKVYLFALDLHFSIYVLFILYSMNENNVKSWRYPIALKNGLLL
jgi:hypothetical protein